MFDATRTGCTAVMENRSPRSPKSRQSGAQAPVFRPVREMTGQVAGGCIFTLLPVLEGKWSGDAFSVDANSQRLTSSTTIFFDHAKQGWDVRLVRASEDCHVSERHYFLRPTAHGQAKIECGVSPENATYREESGGSFSTFIIQDDQGNLVLSETWNLNIRNEELTRVLQSYDSGHLSSIVVCKEKKV